MPAQWPCSMCSLTSNLDRQETLDDMEQAWDLAGLLKTRVWILARAAKSRDPLKQPGAKWKSHQNGSNTWAAITVGAPGNDSSSVKLPKTAAQLSFCLPNSPSPVACCLLSSTLFCSLKSSWCFLLQKFGCWMSPIWICLSLVSPLRPTLHRALLSLRILTVLQRPKDLNEVTFCLKVSPSLTQCVRHSIYSAVQYVDTNAAKVIRFL